MNKSKIIVVMPAYNAAKTITKTIGDIPKGLVNEIIVVDDHSTDDTVKVARKLGLTVFEHPNNLGYGGNQKTCYWEALKRNPDIVVMLHPDYQYDPRLVPYLAGLIEDGICDIVLGNRIRTRREVINGGMPLYKYFFNRMLTITENLFLGLNLSEYHTGYRAFSKKALEAIPWQKNSNDFVFDQQFMFSAISFNLKISSISIPTRYYNDSSSIQWWPGVKFGLESLWVLFRLFLQGKS